MLYTALLKSLFRAFYGDPPQRTMDHDSTGLVLVADGVGGFDLCGTGLCHEVARAGLPLVVRVISWGHGLWRWHADLTNVANHQARAAAVAAEVEAFRARRPVAPVFLVGKSGGSGIIVWALEALPAEAVEAAVLIAPALSPRYDLSRALRAIRRELVVYWSPLDLIVLGLGTRLFGTIDRARSVSAGLVGFRRPEGTDPDQYAKLRQIRWQPRMASTGYLGGHVGPDSPAFLRKYIIPLLCVPSRQEMAEEARPVSSEVRAAPIT
ncbi:MAG: alpha/beta hydrolase [Isosphaeraceae bacterium]|nr:alpha/beta hydrolase [Isosphaeraceae bacterium]